MPVQTTYVLAMDPFIAGQLVDNGESEVSSIIAEAAIVASLVVIRGATTRTEGRPPTTPDVSDVDAIIATILSASTAQTLSGGSLDGVVGGGEMFPPRNVTLTLSSHANWDATTAVVTGLDENGASLTENFSIPDAGNATVTGTKRFKRVTSIVIPAQSGTSGTFTVGTRAVVTATGASATKVVCTSVAGELHSYELTTANVTLQTQTADPGIATDMAAILLADPDWYGLASEYDGGRMLILFSAQADNLCEITKNA